MAENNLYGIMNEADSDLNGTMYEYFANQPSGTNNASDIKYDNSSSGLTAENVQEAIDEIAQNGTGGVSNYDLLSNRPKINGVTLSGNLSPENIGAMPMFTGTDETDPDTSLKGLMFVQCSDELKAILGMPRAYIHQYFYSTGAIAENQTRAQIAIAYGDVAKMAIRQYYGIPKAWTPWVALSGAGGSDITIDSELSDESENPVQNKAIAKALNNKADSSDIPKSLPNPNTLTFTGAVSAEYDGSSPVTVEIPAGGSGSVNVDTEITENGANPVTSAAIFAALAGKSDKAVHMWKRSKPKKTAVPTAGEQGTAIWENIGTEDAEYFAYNSDGSVSVLKKGKYLLISQLRLSTSTSGGKYGSIYAYVNGVQMGTNPFTCYSLVQAGITLYVSFPQLTTVFDLAAGDNVLIKGKGHPDAGYTITDTAGFFMLLYLGE